jgi:hypothetical protein
MKAQGAKDTEMKLMGRFLNAATGRGTVPKDLEKYMPALNAFLFSPRLQLSLAQLPLQIGKMLLSKNPYERKVAARALVTFAGFGASIYGIARATGSKVELDPRSGDFGKIIIGDTRLDPWRGYVQYARFAAQMLTGERKSAYGNMNDADRGEIAWRFLQSKSSPAVGLLADMMRGETYMGKPVFQDTTGFLQVLREKTIPLALQDIIDAYEMNGMAGVGASAPGLLGVGALTIVNDFVRVKDKIAHEMGYETWDEIDPATQRHIQNTNKELQAAMVKFDRDIMGTAWGDWNLAGKAIEESFKQNVDQIVAQYRATGDGYHFRERIADAYTERRGAYNARELEPRFEDIVRRLNLNNPSQSLLELGPEQSAIKAYYDALWGDDMYDEFGEYRFDLADERKAQLKQSMGDDMFNYVEEYQAMKYETYPQEFQVLMQAKKAMKPYWDIRTQLINRYGETFVESPRGQRLLTKLRQRLRLRDPNIAYYYKMFYEQ